MLYHYTLPCTINLSLIFHFAGLNPSRPDAKQQKETVGHNQVAGSRERQAFLRFPRPVTVLFHLQLSLLADWALCAAGEG